MNRHVLSFPVLLSAPDGSSRTVRFDDLRDANPGAFRPGDEKLLRGWQRLERLGCVVWRTRDALCALCGVPIGEGEFRCWACDHRLPVCPLRRPGDPSMP